MSMFDSLKKRLGIAGEPEPLRAAPAPPPQPVEASPEPFIIPETSCEELIEAMQAGEDVTLLDVRQAWDFQAQHPSGARSLPLNELPARLSELDRDKRYVLSCYHGYTSQDGVAWLIEQGFSNVQSLRGGFSGWAVAGLPIEGKYASHDAAGEGQ